MLMKNMIKCAAMRCTNMVIKYANPLLNVCARCRAELNAPYLCSGKSNACGNFYLSIASTALNVHFCPQVKDK